MARYLANPALPAAKLRGLYNASGRALPDLAALGTNYQVGSSVATPWPRFENTRLRNRGYPKKVLFCIRRQKAQRDFQDFPTVRNCHSTVAVARARLTAPHCQELFAVVENFFEPSVDGCKKTLLWYSFADPGIHAEDAYSRYSR